MRPSVQKSMLLAMAVAMAASSLEAFGRLDQAAAQRDLPARLRDHGEQVGRLVLLPPLKPGPLVTSSIRSAAGERHGPAGAQQPALSAAASAVVAPAPAARAQFLQRTSQALASAGRTELPLR